MSESLRQIEFESARLRSIFKDWASATLQAQGESEKHARISARQAALALKVARVELPYFETESVVDLETEQDRATTHAHLSKLADDSERVAGMFAVKAQHRQLSADEAATAHREHYKANDGAYHDLAVIEAHKDGVYIAVEQPIVVGRSEALLKVFFPNN